MAEPKNAQHTNKKKKLTLTLSRVVDTVHESVIALCRAVISSFWTTVTTSKKSKKEEKKRMKTRTEKTRPDQLSPRLDSRLIMHMDVCTHTARLVYDDAGFSLEMRNSRTVRALQSPFFLMGGDVYCLSLCCL